MRNYPIFILASLLFVGCGQKSSFEVPKFPENALVVAEYRNDVVVDNKEIEAIISTRKNDLIQMIFNKAGVTGIDLDANPDFKWASFYVEDFDIGEYTRLSDEGIFKVPPCALVLSATSPWKVEAMIQKIEQVLTNMSRETIDLPYIKTTEKGKTYWRFQLSEDAKDEMADCAPVIVAENGGKVLLCAINETLLQNLQSLYEGKSKTLKYTNPTDKQICKIETFRLRNYMDKIPEKPEEGRDIFDSFEDVSIVAGIAQDSPYINASIKMNNKPAIDKVVSMLNSYKTKFGLFAYPASSLEEKACLYLLNSIKIEGNDSAIEISIPIK